MNLVTKTAAASEFGVTVRTLNRYIADGLPVYFDRFVDADEMKAEMRRRHVRMEETQMTRRARNSGLVPRA